MKLISTLLLLFAAFSGNAQDTSPSVEIMHPLEKTRYVGEKSTFVINADYNNVDEIIILQDNNITTSVDVTSAKKVYCEPVKLSVGVNNITVNMYKNGSLIDTKKRELYYLSELFEGSDEDDAAEYDMNYFHVDKKEEKCKACHDMTSNVPIDGEAFEDVSKTTCFKCHQEKISTRNTHAPTANWLCLDCHNGKVAEYNVDDEGASKYLAPDPISDTCFFCHDTVEEWTMNKYTHGPVNDGRCVRCHNPHGSNNEFFLRKHIWDLCTTCHSEKANGKHIVGSFVFSRNKGSHPTKAPKDPARPEREFVCSSCHNPHGSSGIFLLRMKGSIPFNVCKRCHDK